MICSSCGRREAESGRDWCFRCRVATVGFTFTGGGSYGRSAFRERTNAEFIAEHVGDVRRPEVEKIDGKVWS